MGGQALYALVYSFSATEAQITCLVRSDKKAQQVQHAFPGRIRIVIGSLDDLETIEHESEDADLVFRKVCPYRTVVLTANRQIQS